MSALSVLIPLVLAVAQAPSTAALLKELQSRDSDVRIRACDASAHAKVSDPRVVRALLNTKDEPAPPQQSTASVRYHAVEALIAAGPDAVPILIEALAERRLLERASSALGRIRPVDKRTIPALRKALNDNTAAPEDSTVALAISALGPEAKDLVPDLVALVASKSLLKGALDGGIVAAFYCDLFFALGGIGPDAGSAIPSLLALTEVEKGLNAPMVRGSSIMALGKIGFGTSDAQRDQVLAAIRRLLADRDKDVVRKATDAAVLLDAQYKASPDARVNALAHLDPRVRLQACRILGAMGSTAAPAREALERVATKDADESVRRAASTALQNIGQ